MNTTTQILNPVVTRDFSLNRNWRFTTEDQPSYALTEFDDNDWQQVALPHSNQILPHKDFHASEYQFVAWYRKPFQCPKLQPNQSIHVRFEGVMAVASVYVNGVKIGTHRGGFTAFEYDITSACSEGNNVLAVRVDAGEHTDMPPEGNIVDYMLFGGIYRNVSLIIHGGLFIDDVFFYTESLAVDGSKAGLKGKLRVVNQTDMDVPAQLKMELLQEHSVAAMHTLSADVSANQTRELTAKFDVVHPVLWSPESPSLYTVRVTLLHMDTDVKTALDTAGETKPGSLSVSGVSEQAAEDANVFDIREMRFGIRTITVDAEKILLNGKSLKLRGLNRHQTYPYIGGAAPDRLQYKDAEILKKELGLNYIRTSHYPQSPAFLDACDEYGLLVFTELPGWQHIGGDEWKQEAVRQLQELVLRDRNHPSVFMWGVRINESPDDHDFYTETNQVARNLDPSRPTGGVRNFRNSEFLEDVFTINDFSMTVLPSTHTPQLVTEYLGHMYPAKSVDPESRLVQHAMYHAEIVNRVYNRDDIVGASGWCAFDYNSQEYFGPGDMVCYHGVMDIFRQPKFAAQFYKSQKDPDSGIVLSAATYLTFATPEHTELLQRHIDLDHMEEQLKSPNYTFPVYIFTNCDEVEVEMNGVLLGFAKLAEGLSDLPHPPRFVEIPGYRVFGEMTLHGYIGGSEVISEVIRTPRGISQLVVQADDLHLIADGSDMTRVSVSAVDINGTLCSYANRAITFEVTGAGRLIGENPIALEGGRVSVYVQTTQHPGQITVKAKAFGLEEQTLHIQSMPDKRDWL